MIAQAIIAALAMGLLFGLALIGVAIVDRRRGQVRQRIAQAVGGYAAAGPSSGPGLRLDAASKAASRPGLGLLPIGLRLWAERASSMTGEKITPRQIFLIGGVSAVVVGLVAGRALSLGPITGALAGIAAGLLVPVMLLRFMRARFGRKFLQLFPDALDLVVRAIKAGLPVSEALSSVALEIGDPVGSEFRRVVDEIRIAVRTEDALAHAAARIQLVDFRFLVAALTLQRQTGGNLAETFSNLSSTIRRRNEARLKASALSSEGRASAWVLGVLPFALGTLLYLVNRKYMMLLIADPRGNKILIVAAVSLTIGILVMRNMIKRALR